MSVRIYTRRGEKWRKDLKPDNTDRKGDKLALNLPAGLRRMSRRDQVVWAGRVVRWAAHLARDTRMRQPPENFCVGRFCISGSKPRPAKIRRALASAAAAPIARNSSYTWEEREEETCPEVAGSPKASPCPLSHLLYLL